MRSDLGDDSDKLDTPGDDIPHYFQYHLENPGADVLIAALQPPIHAPTGASAEPIVPNGMSPQDNADLTLADSVDTREI